MKKGFISILLWGILAMSLVACGKTESDMIKDETTQNAIEETSEDTEDETVVNDKPSKVIDTEVSYSYETGENPDEATRNITTYQYNEKGDVISVNDSLETITYEYEYDDEGNCINKKEYLNGELSYEEVYKYDDNKNIIYKDCYYHYNNSECVTFEYEYNDNSQLIKVSRTNIDIYDEYLYDGDKLVLEKEYNNSNVSSYIEYEYENDLLIKETCYCSEYEEGKEFFCDSYTEYEYDSYGYMIKKIECVDEDYFYVSEYKYKTVQ